MKISKEVRIGVLVTFSVLIFFLGLNFLKKASFISKEKDYYCYYSNVDGLMKSANVMVMGMTVGHVADMKIVPGKGVEVKLQINKEVELTEGTVASLESPDLLGAKVISLIMGPGPAMLSAGANIPTANAGGMMNNVTNELTPRLRELRGTIGKFDTTLNSVNAVVGMQNQKELAEALHSLNNSAKNIEQLTNTLSKESTQITAILKNAQSFTASLASQNDTIKLLLANANKLMRQLGNAPVEKTVTELQSTIVQVKEVIAKINKGEGSLGLLINDKELHRNLNTSLHSLDSLMTDIKAHPTRYINVTVFGSKKKS